MVVVNINYFSVWEIESASVAQLINTLKKSNFFPNDGILKAQQSKCSTEISLSPFPSNQTFKW